ncbi:hypothetical protein LJC53_02900 [Bacteroidales bacterium OttesenSCG-928-C03]|nr:hypothetical protein [Bacteroidales bacterium OttesenSCG-928-E04]MDL2308516.1 hypothetical protein [Bacteroidales bacterium OttesenSCG-928-C03]
MKKTVKTKTTRWVSKTECEKLKSYQRQYVLYIQKLIANDKIESDAKKKLKSVLLHAQKTRDSLYHVTNRY